MSEENASLLRFSLEENVWFQRGQEVEELYSISLEPNVSAHQAEQYIILKGTLDLMGEYKPVGTEEQKDGADDPFRRYVSVIEQGEHELFEFHQQFPVDITIPAERVRDMDDLNVGVHTFDYRLPEKGYLQIAADLWIGGVYEDLPDDQQRAAEVEGRVETSHYQKEIPQQYEEDHHPHLWNKAADEVEESAEEITILSDVHYKQEDEQEEAPLYRLNQAEDGTEDDQESNNQVDPPVNFFDTYTPFTPPSEIYVEQDNLFYVESKLSPRVNQQQADHEGLSDDESEEKEYTPFAYEPEQSDNQAKHENSKQSFTIPSDRTFDEGPPKLDEALSSNTQADNEESPVKNRAQHLQSEVDELSNQTESIEEDTDESQVHEKKEKQAFHKYAEKQYRSNEYSTEKKKRENENGNEEQTESETKSLLYDLFTQQEETKRTKVRVCIVQSGDSIELLANRYKTSVQHIARVNGIELTDLKAGQVIYIPEAAASYK